MPRQLGKAHETAKSFRIPVSRKKCAPKSFRNVTLSKKKGIKALVCCPTGEYKRGKCQVGIQLRNIIYDKDRWTEKKAESHAKRAFKLAGKTMK